MNNPEHHTYQFFYTEAERLLLASDLLNFGVWEFDFTTNELVWDDKMHDIYAVKKEDFHNRMEDFKSRVHPEDVPDVENAMQQIIGSSNPIFAQFRIIRPNGEVRIISGNVKCIHDAANKPVRLIGINHDITEKQVLHEKLEKQNKQLHTIAWTQSHEIRKPVANIIGLLQLYELKKNDLTDERVLNYLKISAIELDELIKDIIARTKSAEI